MPIYVAVIGAITTTLHGHSFRRQAGGVIGWTSAIAAFGPFLFGIGLAMMSPTVFYAIGIVWCVLSVAITWLRYARKGAPKPS